MILQCLHCLSLRTNVWRECSGILQASTELDWAFHAAMLSRFPFRTDLRWSSKQKCSDEVHSSKNLPLAALDHYSPWIFRSRSTTVDSFVDLNEIARVPCRPSTSVEFHSQSDVFEDADPTGTRRETIRNTRDICLKRLEIYFMNYFKCALTYRNCLTWADKKWKCISSSDEQVTWEKYLLSLASLNILLNNSYPTENASDEIGRVVLRMNVILKVSIWPEIFPASRAPFVRMPRCKMHFQRHNGVEALVAERTLKADVILN